MSLHDLKYVVVHDDVGISLGVITSKSNAINVTYITTKESVFACSILRYIFNLPSVGKAASIRMYMGNCSIVKSLIQYCCFQGPLFLVFSKKCLNEGMLLAWSQNDFI